MITEEPETEGGATKKCFFNPSTYINRRFRARLRATERAPQRASCCSLGGLYVHS